MVNGNGNVSFNGITDSDLVLMLQIKEKHEASIDFLPQGMQAQQAGTPGGSKKFYNQVRFDWRGPEGLKALFQIVEALLSAEKHDQQP
jgi:hypothetical protein